jgi:hypothetical protein
MSFKRKDEFMIEMVCVIGHILPEPLINIIVKFARPFYIFASHETHQWFVYDHFTRQIVDKQSIPCDGYDYDYVLLNLSFLRNGGFDILAFFDYEDHISISPVQFDVNRIFQEQQKLEVEWAMPIMDEWSGFTKNAVVLTSDLSLFFRNPDCQWRRFDLVERKWDSVLIQDQFVIGSGPTVIGSRPTLVGILTKETLNVTAIGRRSFIGIESLKDSKKRYTYRCFVYDGDRKSKKKHDIRQLENIVADGILPNKLLAFGLVKNGHKEMILAIFHPTLAFIIKILTRSPSLKFSRPTRIRIDTVPIINSQCRQTFFILEEQLWVVVFSTVLESRNLAYRFSFQTTEWSLSGTVPRELCSSTLQTIV